MLGNRKQGHGHRWQRVAEAVLVAILLVSISSQAAPETEYGVESEFARMLIDRGNLNDYVEDQIEQMKRDYRRQTNENILVEAEFLLKQRKVEDAKKLLAQIPKDDPAYIQSIVLRTQVVTDSDQKLAAFKDYFGAIKQPKGNQQIEDYRRMVMRYVHELMQLERFDEAAKALELQNNIAGEADSATQRRIQLRTAQILLKSAEEAVNAAETAERQMAQASGADKAPHKKTMETKRKQATVLLGQAIAKLKALVWEQDYIAVLAYPQLMHAYNLNNEPDNAIDMFNSSYELMQAVEKDNRDASPLPNAFFYLAEAYMTKAKASRELEKKNGQKQKDQTMALMQNAAKLYMAVFHKYSSSPLQAEALQQFDFINQVRVKFYDLEAIPAPGGQAQSAKVKATHEIFRDKNFGLAAKNYIEAVAMDPTTPDAAEALVMAAACYRNLQLWWEAETAVDLLVGLHPTSKFTGDAVYNLGLNYYQQSRQQVDPEGAAQMERLGVQYLTLFVEVAPTHPRAAMTAYTIAETAYANAGKLRKEAKEMEEQGAAVGDINAKIAEAKTAYAQSIPLYESVVQNHAISENAVKSLYKLGWVYQILEDHEKAARSFLRYSEREEEPTQKVLSVYFAADNFMRSENSDEAIANFNKILEWTARGGQYADQGPEVAKYRQQAQTLLPWAYDAKKDSLLAQIERNRQVLRQIEAEAAEAARAAEAGEEEEAEEEDFGDGPAPIGNTLTVEQVQQTIADLEEQVAEFRKLAIDGLEAQRQGDSDKDKPNAMAKLGVLYSEMGDYASAAEVLSELDRQYPETPAGQQALFTLFRSYLRTDNLKEARQVAGRMIERLPGYTFNNVVFIASRLFEEDKQLQVTVLDPQLAMAANDELIKRAQNTPESDPNYASLQQQRQRAYYNKALSLLLMEKYDQAIAAAEAYRETFPSGGRFFDAAILKAKALRAKGDIAAANAELGGILNKIDRANLEATYFETLVEGARTLMMTDEASQVRAATVRLVPILAMGDAATEGGEKWLEAATYEAARAYALLGNDEKVAEIRNQYRNRYGDSGAWHGQIWSLPAPLPQ